MSLKSGKVWMEKTKKKEEKDDSEELENKLLLTPNTNMTKLFSLIIFIQCKTLERDNARDYQATRNMKSLN